MASDRDLSYDGVCLGNVFLVTESNVTLVSQRVTLHSGEVAFELTHMPATFCFVESWKAP